MNDSRSALQEIFRDVFDDPAIILRDDMKSADIAGWDSVMHIDLLIAVERAMGIKFATAEMSRLKEPDQNIGSFVRLIDSKRKMG
jgi:acyl carrier protein